MALLGVRVLSWLGSFLTEPLVLHTDRLSEWLLSSGVVPPMTADDWHALKQALSALQQQQHQHTNEYATCFDASWAVSRKRAHFYHAAQVLERLVLVSLPNAREHLEQVKKRQNELERRVQQCQDALESLESSKKRRNSNRQQQSIMESESTFSLSDGDGEVLRDAIDLHTKTIAALQLGASTDGLVPLEDLKQFLSSACLADDDAHSRLLGDLVELHAFLHSLMQTKKTDLNLLTTQLSLRAPHVSNDHLKTMLDACERAKLRLESVMKSNSQQSETDINDANHELFDELKQSLVKQQEITAKIVQVAMDRCRHLEARIHALRDRLALEISWLFSGRPVHLK